MMDVVCAYCKKDMGRKEGPEGRVSHGICEACLAKLLPEIEALEAAQQKKVNV